MRKKIEQLNKLTDTIVNIKDKVLQCGDDTVLGNLVDGMIAINREMFGCDSISAVPIDLPAEQNGDLRNQMEAWAGFIKKELEVRQSFGKKTDLEFYELTQHIRYAGKEQLVNEMKEALERIREQGEANYQKIRDFHKEYQSYWGALDLDAGILDMFEDRAEQLTQHLEDFIWLYGELADYRSKQVLYAILNFWLTYDFALRIAATEHCFSDYYDFDLIDCDENEVFVDLGAYTGDSAESFIENYGNYKRIYLYEVTPESVAVLQEKFIQNPKCVIRNVGVADKQGELYLDATSGGADDPSSNILSTEKGIPVQTVTLDEDILEPVTFLKMDIEGSELMALNGAQNHIKKDKPKLAICTYHNNHHIWEIPRRMRELNPDYKLYMRYNGPLNAATATEYVTFGINENEKRNAI